jgi:cytidyltransferase-like protein
MSSQEKYILYGASFNPPHIGHFSAIMQMLEEYDKVIVFPYPKKYVKGTEEVLPPLGQRMKMLEIFTSEFFPILADRLCIANLAAELNHKDRFKDGVLHTYDYLKFVQQRIPAGASLSVCLGFEVQNVMRKEDFYREKEMKSEFNYFYLQEENTIKSEDLRQFFTGHKVLKSKKDELYIRSAVGNDLATYIFSNNLYGITKKEKKSEVKESEDILEVSSVDEPPKRARKKM